MRTHEDRGFTLIELLVVISIIGVRLRAVSQGDHGLLPRLTTATGLPRGWSIAPSGSTLSPRQHRSSVSTRPFRPGTGER